MYKESLYYGSEGNDYYVCFIRPQQGNFLFLIHLPHTISPQPPPKNTIQIVLNLAYYLDASDWLAKETSCWSWVDGRTGSRVHPCPLNEAGENPRGHCQRCRQTYIYILKEHELKSAPSLTCLRPPPAKRQKKMRALMRTVSYIYVMSSLLCIPVKLCRSYHILGAYLKHKKK